MSQQERLLAMEALWDAITHDPTDLASPSWHKDIIQARRARIDAGDAEFVSLAELKKQKRK